MSNSNDVLHLVLGDYAAGTLEVACRAHGVAGRVHCIPDDLGNGPLDDGVARIAYMRQCYAGFDDWPYTATDAFEPWHALAGQLAEKPQTLTIWHGPNASEATLLAMACWWIAPQAAALMSVAVPGDKARAHVATYTPEELAAFHVGAMPISDEQRAVLAASFERLRADGGVRRRWEDGRIFTVPVDTFDDLLIESCGPDWHVAARIVAAAMRKAERRDGLSDLFLASRLQALIAAGRIEAESEPTRLRSYRVRRSSS